MDLTETERHTLVAALDRILPSDDGPGATEAGVAEYVEQALRERRHRALEPLVTSGLERLRALARELHGHDFADCTPAQRDDVLRQLQRLPERAPRLFLSRLVQLGLEGFLCDPVHGGNRDGAGWRAVGYAPRNPGPVDPG